MYLDVFRRDTLALNGHARWLVSPQARRLGDPDRQLVEIGLPDFVLGERRVLKDRRSFWDRFAAQKHRLATLHKAAGGEYGMRYGIR
jgi:hypothetical protein